MTSDVILALIRFRCQESAWRFEDLASIARLTRIVRLKHNASPLDILEERLDTPLNIPQGAHVMTDDRSSILQGTLDLMVLKTLEQMGPLHGYGIALRIEQIGQDALIVNQGTVYLCLVRLVQKKWVKAEWGASDNNRKAKYY